MQFRSEPIWHWKVCTPGAFDTSCCASPNALLPASLEVTGAGGIPKGTVLGVPCHHTYKLLSTFASTQLSWVSCQAGISVLQGVTGAVPVTDDVPLAVNGSFAVGMTV